MSAGLTLTLTLTLSLQKGEATQEAAESLEKLACKQARYRNDPPFFQPPEN
jgi:hypothetical protein